MGSRIIIRADASTRIGSGHVMRCLTLAEELRDADVEVSFISRVHPGNLNDLIREKGFCCHELPEASAIPSNEQSVQDARSEYASWLGVSQQQDARESIEAFAGAQNDWLIVDHYGLDEEWEKLLRPYAVKIMVIDDLADRRHDCDLLLDQNYFIDGEMRYDELVSPACTKLLGPKYALLRKEFREARKNLRKRDGTVKRVLVFLGGADPENITGMVMEALSDPRLLYLQVDVVIGSQNLHRGKIKKLVYSRPQTTLYIQATNMAELMRAADLAIGAGGSTTWERCCMGLASIVLPIAKNQIPIANSIQQAGCGIVIENITISNISKKIRSIVKLHKIKDIGKKALSMTDGSGIVKIEKFFVSKEKNSTRTPKKRSKIYQISFTSDEKSWINPFITKLTEELKREGHKVQFIHDYKDIAGGDFNFILSYSRILKKETLVKNKHNLVVHESDLPNGKGWSPLTWQVLEGKNDIPICLIEAGEQVDSGKIYIKEVIRFNGNELLDELHFHQGEKTIAMCRQFIKKYPEIINTAVSQIGEGTFYTKRTPKDSELDPTKTLQEQFNLLRVVDNERYPAFFDINNCRYELLIRRQ